MAISTRTRPNCGRPVAFLVVTLVWLLYMEAFALAEGTAPRAEAPIEIAMGVKAEPGIHGPRVVGATPGRPFLFLIPAMGEGPLTFGAKGLPAGLSLDGKTGIISGALEKAGTTEVELSVTNARGTATRTLTIVGGDHKLTLTPPMGWNSWYVWSVVVDDEKVRAAVDGLIQSGLAAHGYQYVCIDDTWEGDRGPDGVIRTNRRFPDMKALADYVHSKGLKFGIYSSPGLKTCAGYTGSYGHEQQDAETYAAWGVDFVKYDWCSYGDISKDKGLEELQKPYRVMRAALDQCGRDMVYSLCQYGMGNVWEWGAAVGGNLWRTTGDMGGTYEAMTDIGFAQNGKEAYAGPGHWNDPDMLVLGAAAWGEGADGAEAAALTPNEQVTYVTLWSLLAAPLIVSCDFSKMDPFTLALLTNDEVIDVNQDVLGSQAYRRSQQGTTEVWAKAMSDGALAVGLFNRGPSKAEVTARWSDLGISGPRAVRDLWAQKDRGTMDGAYTVSVPGHGARMIKIEGLKDPGTEGLKR